MDLTSESRLSTAGGGTGASGEAGKRLLSDLQRYAGWLAKDHASVAVRADVQALGAAMDTGCETSLLLVALDKDIARLPSGSIRTMLRRVLAKIRPGLESRRLSKGARE